MPGYVIHVAIAQEFLRKNKKKYSSEFIKGTIAPDMTNKKSETHYGKSPAYTNLKEYLLKNNINTDFNRGFFLHLIADYLFYNKYLDRFEKPQIYDDYDITNKDIIKKYNVIVPNEVKDCISLKNGKLTILTLQLAYQVIDEISSLNLETVKKEVLNDLDKWNTYKKLI